MGQQAPPGPPDDREPFLKLDEVEQRLARIERHLGIGAIAPSEEQPDPEARARAAPVALSETLPLVGRTFVVLGGAFVLRAVTESGVLPAAVGAVLGLIYALVWVAIADRAAGRGALRSAIWHSVAAVVIVCPLLWETTAKFASLTPAQSTGALSVITAAGLLVAWRRDLRAMGWIVTAAAVATSLALAVGAQMLVLVAGFLLALGIATLGLGYSRGWRGPAWLVALVANGTVMLITLIALEADPERAAALLRYEHVRGLLLALVLAYVGCLSARAWIGRAELSAAEIAVGSAATAIGLGGSIALVARSGSGGPALGTVALLIGFGGYAASFRIVDRTQGRTNFIFFSSLAMIFSIIAAVELLSPAIFTLVMAGLGVLMAWVGAMRERATLNLHGAVYAVAASLTSGLLTGGATALFSPDLATGWVSARSLMTLSGVLAYCAFPVAVHGRTWGRVTTLPRLAVLVVALLGSAGTLVVAVSGLFSGRVSHEVLLQVVAVLRTAVLALSSVTLAGIGRLPSMQQANWLVYPILVAGGLKLLLEDLRVETPAALVASFAFYGTALILAPRLARR